MNPSVKQEGEPDGEGGADRYFCPYPGCKRSFAELWRLKVHYRAPPDIRGSGKERGHGTELSHCPKCGKGLKPGKHHVGCSGGKTAPRQAKRAKLAANGGLPQDGMLNDAQAMYGGSMLMQGGYGPGMQGPAMTSYNQLNAFNQQYQTMQQQFQPDMSSFYSMQNPAQTQQMMVGGLMQQGQLPLQPQPQSGGSFSSPVLGMGLMDTTAANGQLGQSAGSGDMSTQTTQYYQQQQQQMQQLMPLQQQPQQLMPMQQPPLQQQQDFLQPTMQHQQSQQQPSMDLLAAPQQVQQQPQQQQQFMLPPPIKQESLPSMSSVNTTYMPAQPQQQQQQHVQSPHMVGQMPEQGYGMSTQDAAAAGLMPPPPPVPLMQMQQQQQQHTHQPPLQQHPVPQQRHQQQHLQQQPNTAVMAPPSNLMPPPAPVPPPSQPAANPAVGPISSTLFDEIDNVPAAGVGESSGAADQAAGGQSRAPSPPPLPPDFPMPTSGMGTLFNFSQFSQKLPAARGPSQQMAMMPRGMEQELPPSMDDLWTPEATYDHHSEGDLMQLLFGAPEQPPTMATIHLHHFLEDDACSSPLLTGLLGGSMDDLKAAEADHAQQDVAAAAPGVATATAAPGAAVQPPPYEQKNMMLPPAAVDMQHQHCQPAVANNNAVLPTKADVAAGYAAGMLMQHGHPQSCLMPGTNGVMNGQYGAAVQVQMLQMRNRSGDGASAVLPIKGEDGCLLQKAGVPSMPEAVASRAT